MKKVLAVAFALMLSVSFTAVPASADMGEKLMDGLKRIAMSPKNIPDDLSAEYEAAEFKPFGVLGGLVKGLVETGVDIVGGAFEVLTFPIDSE